MSTQTISTAPYPTISEEVLTFAREQKVEQYLQPLIELTRQIYPSATSIAVAIEDDPEFSDRHIVFELDVSLSIDESLEADERWLKRWMQIEPYPRSCIFRLRVNLR